MSSSAKNLSDDAKAVAGAYFGIMGEKASLVFHMVKSRPTARTQAALDELVAAKIISRTPLNKHGGVEYRPISPTRQFGLWLRKNEGNPGIKFQLVEPIGGSDGE